MTDDIYQEQIIDHYKNPRSFGGVKEPNVKVRESNASCGDLIEITMKVGRKTIKQVGFKGVGCAISVAAASMLMERINKGEVKQSELESWGEEEMEEMLGIEVSETRKKCSMLALKAVKKGLLQIENLG